MTRSRDGRETWRRLLEWDKGSGSAERLAAHMLRIDGYESVDPSHPLGGQDGLKDVVCQRQGEKWIGAAFFPRGQQSLKTIISKLEDDLAGVEKNAAVGMAFVTNQEIRLAEREELAKVCGKSRLDLFHLERVASSLDSPRCYGLRLEFLDIEMTKEEQLSFIAARDSVIADMNETLKTLWLHVSSSGAQGSKSAASMPTVAPRVLDDYRYASSSFWGPRAHECKACGGVFMIANSSWSSLSASFGRMNVITCPYCGRTERYTGY